MKMGSHFRLGLVAVIGGLVALGGTLAAALNESQFKTVVTGDLKYLQTKLDGETAAVNKARSALKGSAIVLAHIAQTQMSAPGADKAQLATLRDEALKIAEAVGKKDYEKAKMLAKALTADVKAASGVKTEPIELIGLHDFDLSELMASFRIERANGRGFEKAVRDNGKKIADMNEATELAARMIAIAELTKGFAPKTAAGRKTPELWNKYSKEMAEASADAVAALGKKDAKASMASFKKIDASCTNCHNVFRDE